MLKFECNPHALSWWVVLSYINDVCRRESHGQLSSFRATVLRTCHVVIAKMFQVTMSLYSRRRRGSSGVDADVFQLERVPPGHRRRRGCSDRC